MEALVAVSLAGNILQFLDFTADTISKSRQIHTSLSGTLKEHDDLKTITTNVKSLSGRLQTLGGPVEPALEHLCSRCREVADELLEALENHSVKGIHTRFQSFRKALKAIWGKEKLRILEGRLAGIRQELTLHVTVELRSQIDVLQIQQTQSFQALDHATKEGAQKILDVLQDNRNHLAATTDAQTRQLRALHAQTESILNNGFDSAAANLVKQTRTTCTLTAKEQERSRSEILNAVANAASGYDDALSTEVENISTRIDEANENTRVQITESLDRNQTIMKQKVQGLQRGLRQLELEIDKKIEELKKIVTKINNTPEGPDRKMLEKMGNSTTIVLISLHELYETLQEMLRSLLHKARIAFGTLFGQQNDRSAILNETFELEISSPQVGPSLPMYYAFYYRPLFRNQRCEKPASEFFPSPEMSSWINRTRLIPVLPCDSSSEAYAFLGPAMNGHELVWTMATLVAGLNACLSPKEAILVLSTALSLCYDPNCVLPMNGTWLDTDIPTQVARFFDNRSALALQRPRYGLDSTLGRRLSEDYLLMSHLANECGLQEEVSRKMNVGHKASTGARKAELTLTLVALASQSSSWKAFKMTRGTYASPTQRILFHKESLWVDQSASLVIDLLYAVRAARIPIQFHEQPTLPFGAQRNRNDFPTGWYGGQDCTRLLKTRSWWPSGADCFNWSAPGKLDTKVLTTIQRRLAEQIAPTQTRWTDRLTKQPEDDSDR